VEDEIKNFLRPGSIIPLDFTKCQIVKGNEIPDMFRLYFAIKSLWIPAGLGIYYIMYIHVMVICVVMLYAM
jgi:hypothetical protein